MNNKIIHSFYSERCSDYSLFLYVCYFTLSCLFAKHSNIELSIHTDDRFADCIKNVPYKHIYNDLNNCYEAPKKFFAYAKLKALEKEPLGTIHIDGDVFLKKNKMLQILDFNNYDCITQHLENRQCMEFAQVWDESYKGFLSVEYMPYMKRELNYMYNCGVLGFNNERLFEDWYNGYFIMLERAKQMNIDWSPDACPDIIIEQQQLTDLCNFNNYKVKTLFEMPTLDAKDDVDEYVYSIGYQHVVCDKERDLPKCLLCIKILNKNIYNELKYRWKDYEEIFVMAERLNLN